MKAHPEIPAEKFVLQDLKEPIAFARAGSFLPKDVQTMEHDFWTPQPVKGQYLILSHAVPRKLADMYQAPEHT